MDNETALIPDLVGKQARRSKDRLSRLWMFVQWLNTGGKPWYYPNLLAYRDYLLKMKNLREETVENYLTAVRARYRALLEMPILRQQLEEMAKIDPSLDVDKAMLMMTQAVDVRVTRLDFEPVSPKRIDLLPSDVADLLRRPGVTNWVGLRDTAIIATAVCTGLRPGEIGLLKVEDVHLEGNHRVVHVPDGAGSQHRHIICPQEVTWFTKLIDAWTGAAQITTGPIFRSFLRNSTQVRSKGITARAIEDMLKQYPITSVEDGTQTVTVRPFDLRRFYARLLYTLEVDVSVIQGNLGHDAPETTLKYIGSLSRFAADQTPLFDLAKLEQVNWLRDRWGE